jgi:hypothetical protein
VTLLFFARSSDWGTPSRSLAARTNIVRICAPQVRNIVCEPLTAMLEVVLVLPKTPWRAFALLS